MDFGEQVDLMDLLKVNYFSSLEDHAILFLAKQIQKEHSIEH